MRKPQDTKNLLLVSKYVVNHFGLTTDSARLFKHRVLFEPNIAPEYKAIIGDAPDLRRRIKIDRSDISDIDEGWNSFKSIYPDFIDKYSVSYNDFIQNKITVRKNEIKIYKLLIEHYTSSASNIAKAIYKSNTYFWNEFRSIKERVINILKKEPENARYRSIAYDEISDHFVIYYFDNNPFSEKRMYVKTEEVIEIEESIINSVTTIIKNSWDFIGSKTLPKRKEFELVISCNPADMFMASTSEKWGSCISVDSDYSECYWSGLPGAIVDKNRAIVYITDGEKKEYRGIVVDRFISRSFLLTARSREDNATYISIVREYPVHVNFMSLLNNNLKEEFRKIHPGTNCVSRYFFEAMYFELYSDKYVKLCNIYLDNSSIQFAGNNKTYAPMNYCYHKFSGSGYPDIAVHSNFELRVKKYEQELYFEWSDGLSGLIERDKSLDVDKYRIEEMLYA